MKYIAAICVFASLLVTPIPVSACGVASDTLRANVARTLEQKRKVRGTFRILEKRETLIESYNGERYNSYTVYGRIETKRGTYWNTVHTYDDLIVMCASYYKPQFDGEGIFYVGRQKEHGPDFPQIDGESAVFYDLFHWDGDYLQTAAERAAEAHIQ